MTKSVFSSLRFYDSIYLAHNNGTWCILLLMALRKVLYLEVFVLIFLPKTGFLEKFEYSLEITKPLKDGKKQKRNTYKRGKIQILKEK